MDSNNTPFCPAVLLRDGFEAVLGFARGDRLERYIHALRPGVLLMLNTEAYKQRLLAEERDLLGRMKRAQENARQSSTDVEDWSDQAVTDELEDEQLAEASSDWALLEQVRDALQRIENGTFGQCVIDGGPIEEKRLEAEPWTPYCARHAHQRESSSPLGTPSL